MGLEDDRISLYKPTNIALVVEDKELYINKDELMQYSPVFRNMLSKNFVEKNLTKIKLPGKQIEAFSCFLRCLLPGIAEQITDDNVHHVLPLAHEYQTEILLQNIDTLLALNSKKNEHELSLCDVIDNIIEAEIYGLELYLKVNIDIAFKERYIQLIQESRFRLISRKTKLVISQKHWEYKDKVYCLNHQIHS